MARSIGLEVTDAAVRIADLEGSAKKLKLLHFAEREIPREADRPWADCAADAIAALFDELKLPRERIVSCLDSGDVLFRFLALPFTGADQIQKVVKFELESQIQNYAADDLIVDYITAEQSEKGTLLLTAAAPKTVVRDRLALLEKAGVDPVALDLDVNALFNAFARGIDLQSDEPFVLVHGGTRFTKLLFVQRKIPRFIRTLRFALGVSGGAGTAKASAAAASEGAGSGPASEGGGGPEVATAAGDDEPFVIISSDPAGSAAPGAAGIPGDSPALPPQDRISLLGREVSRFLLSSLSPTAPTCLLLTGEFVRHPEVAPRLEEGTKLVTDTVDFLTGIEHPFGEGGAPPHIAIPLGLALKGLDIDRTHFDFRREEFVFQRRFELIRRTLAVSVVLLLFLLFLPAARYQLLRGQYAEQLDRIVAQQEKVLFDVYPERKGKVQDRDRVVEELKRARREEFEKISGGGSPIPTTAVEYLGIVFDKLRDCLNQQIGGGRNADFYIALDRFACSLNPQTQSSIEFTGQITSPPLAEALQNVLKTVKDFETVSLENVTARPEGKYNYTIRIKIAKPAP